MLELLQVTQPINAIEGISFTLGNLITIGGGLVITISSFLKLQYDQKAEAKATIVRFETVEKEYEKEISAISDNILHVQNGKRALKKDLEAQIDKQAEIVKNRIDKTQDRMEKNKAENQAEFKEINKQLNTIIGLLEAKK